MTNYAQKNRETEQKWFLIDCKKEFFNCRNKRKSLYLQCVIGNVFVIVNEYHNINNNEYSAQFIRRF